MTARTVQVTVEWARLGKEAHDPGYRLLECSDGAIRSKNFEDVLTRYSPGTLEKLPQVTISWLLDSNKQRYYVAIAIYDEPEQGQYDVSGREFVPTRYFCVPFSELAAGSVSYQAMYEQFQGLRLPRPSRDPIETELPESQSAGPAADLAMRVAALLLTLKPVCILGADHVELAQRLQFIDTVASLLPYGIRSNLSASTWASSTYTRHKLRLFFASADRRAAKPDHVVIWGPPVNTPIGHGYADEYIKRLRSGAVQPAQLAQDKELMGFTPKDILKMLERFEQRTIQQQVGGDEPFDAEQPTIQRPVGSDEPVHAEQRTIEQRIDDGGSLVPGGSAAEMSVEELLSSCNYALNGDPYMLESGIGRLQQHLHGWIPEKQWRLAHVITQQRLLRPDSAIDEPLLCQFYGVLLQLLFTAPLSYQSYCRVEMYAGYSDGQRLHAALARAMLDIGMKGPARLLVLNSLGDEKVIKAALLKYPISPAESVAMVADRTLTPICARIVCEIAVLNLHICDQRSKADRQAFRDALHHYHLVSVLQQRHADDPEYQLALLSEMLQFAYHGELDEPAVQGVFGNIAAAPTDALLGATLRMVRSKDVVAVTRNFAFGRIASAGFLENTDRELTTKLLENANSAASVTTRWWRFRRFVPQRDGLWLPMSIIGAVFIVGIVVIYLISRLRLP